MTTPSSSASSSASPSAPSSLFPAHDKTPSFESFEGQTEAEIRRWPSSHPNMHEIVPGLFLGNAGASMDHALLSENGINAMVSIGSPSSRFAGYENNWAAVTHKFVPRSRHHLLEIEDAREKNLVGCLESLVPQIGEMLAPIKGEELVRVREELAEARGEKDVTGGEEEEGRVLVHCTWGISRSASVVIAYLMARKGWSVEQTLAFVREKREEVRPRFLKQLVAWGACGGVLWEEVNGEDRAKKPYEELAREYGWDLFDDEDDEDDMDYEG